MARAGWIAIVCLAWLGGAAAQEPAAGGDPLGPLGPVLRAARDPGLAATPREGAVVLVGEQRDGRALLVASPGDARPLTVGVELALIAAVEEEGGAPQGAGLVLMTGPDRFVAFVLLPKGRTAVFVFEPGQGLRARIQSSYEKDWSEPHRLTMTHDGKALAFGIDGEGAGGFGNQAIARARGPVGLIVLGNATCVVRGYTCTTGEPAEAPARSGSE